MDFGSGHSSDPPCAFWDEIYGLLGEAFRRAGNPPDYGRRVAGAFLDAGLPFPTVLAESVAGGGHDSHVSLDSEYSDECRSAPGADGTCAT